MTATQNTKTFIQELSELLDYDSDFVVEFRDTRLNISEAKDFILNGISERLNLPDVKTLAFFLTQPFSYQYHATLFVEIDFNGDEFYKSTSLLMKITPKIMRLEVISSFQKKSGWKHENKLLKKLTCQMKG